MQGRQSGRRAWWPLALVALLALAWVWRAPPAYIEIAPPYRMAAVDARLLAVQAAGDPVAATGRTRGLALPGYDDIVLQEARQRAFVSAMDGRIWQFDLASGQAAPHADPPLMPAGLRAVPGTDDLLWFCASRLGGVSYPAQEQVGLYELETASRRVRPLLTRVPFPPRPAAGRIGELYPAGERPRLALAAMNAQNSRPIAFCNDLDVSRDGRRIYFSEPFDHPGAGMGAGAVMEGISLGRHGRLWLYDLERQEVSLVAQGYAFLDGVLLEHMDGPRESSVLVTETPKFRILRLHLAGDRAGEDEEVWHSLPGMPDGLDRDAEGVIWVGLLKERTPLVTWVHAHPWIKPLLLRIPPAWLPQPRVTGILALSPDASRPLYYARHDGSRAAEISVVVPGTGRLYLPSFSPHTPGVHDLPRPPLDIR